MTGTSSQIEWADLIRPRVDQEFDRVAAALNRIVPRQTAEEQVETRLILAILEEKRTEVMANESAGYYIRDWQEMTDQVRQMIFRDSRYAVISENRKARRSQ